MPAKKSKKGKDLESDGKFPISEYPDCRDAAELKGWRFVVYGFKKGRIFALWKDSEPFFRSSNIAEIRDRLGIKEKE